MTDRQGWLLLLSDRDALGGSGPAALDQLRLQVGMVQVAQRGPAELRDLYRFREFAGGPFSAELCSDLDVLVGAGNLVRISDAASLWQRYQPTEQGSRHAHWFAERAERRTVEWLGMTRQFVASRTSSWLLRVPYIESVARCASPPARSRSR